MNLINQLSTSLKTKNEAPNRRAADVILKNPQRVNEIIGGISEAAPALLGDCIEVLTLVAEQQPELITPYADVIIPFLQHQKTRVRWETIHCLAYLAESIPGKIKNILPVIEDLIRQDESTIVRDYAVTTLGNYGKTSFQAANKVFPILKMAINIREGKHAKLVLEAFVKMSVFLDSERDYLNRISEVYLADHRSPVKKGAKQIKGKL